MNRKIIVIGMDNSGKTTLVEQLSDILKCEHIKSLGPGYTKEEMIKEVIRKLELPEKAILERFSILEELVYGKVLRNESKFTYEDMLKIRRFTPLIVYCRPEDEIIYNFGEREQMEGVIEQKTKLLNEWDELVNKLKDDFEVIYYNWKYNKPDDVIDYYIGGMRDEHYTR